MKIELRSKNGIIITMVNYPFIKLDHMVNLFNSINNILDDNYYTFENYTEHSNEVNLVFKSDLDDVGNNINPSIYDSLGFILHEINEKIAE